MNIRVILADDHKLIREGLRSLLAEEDGIEVVAEAEDGRIAVLLVRELAPDVVIMDIGMPGLNGIEATRQIVEQFPSVKVIALSMQSSQRAVVEMLRAGALGYVLKLSAFDELVRAVESVVADKRYLSPAVADVVVEELLRCEPTGPSVFSVLTAREREVLQLLAEGKNSKNIATLLGVSPRTVDVHRKNIMDKLKVGSVAELTRYAVREGLVPLDQ